MATPGVRSFSDPVCLLRQEKGSLELAPEGVSLLENLAEPGAVISIANIRGLQHKALLHALGLLSFPHEPGLYAWTLDRSPAAPALMLIVWESHSSVLLELLILLGTVVLFATEEFLDLEPLLPLATFTSRLHVNATDPHNADIGREMPQLIWLLSAWGSGQRIVSPDDGLATDDGDDDAGRSHDIEQEGRQIKSLADLLEWRLRPELALGFTDDAYRASKAAEEEQERAKAKAQAQEDALAAAAAATAAAAAEAEEAAPAASIFGIGGALKMMHSALADQPDVTYNDCGGAGRNGCGVSDGNGGGDHEASAAPNGNGKDTSSGDSLGIGIGNALTSFHDALRPMRARPASKDLSEVAKGSNTAQINTEAHSAADGQVGEDSQQHSSANCVDEEGKVQQAQCEGGWLEHQAKLRAQELLRSSGDTSVTGARNGPGSGLKCGDMLSPRQRNDTRRAIRTLFPSGRRHCAALVRTALGSDDVVVPSIWRESPNCCIYTAPKALLDKVLNIALHTDSGKMREGKCLLGYCLGGPALLAIAKVWLQFSKAAEAGTDGSDSPGHIDLTTMLAQAAVVICAGAARSARESYRKQLQTELQRTSGDTHANTAGTEQLQCVHPSLRATALAQFDMLSAPCQDFDAFTREKHRMDLADGLDEDMHGASSALDAVFVEQLVKRLRIQLHDEVLQRLKPRRRAAMDSPLATSSPVAKQTGIESVDALRESLQQTLRSFCQNSTGGTAPLRRPQSNRVHLRALTQHEQAVLQFCIATGSRNLSDTATTTETLVQSTEHIDNLSAGMIFDEYANAQLRREIRGAVREALREQKKSLRAAYAERDACIKAELAAQRKSFASATAVAKQQQKQASSELVAVRNALTAGRRRVVEAQRLVGLAVVDESEASTVLEAARTDLGALEGETEEIDRRCAALAEEANSARKNLSLSREEAAQHQFAAQAAVTDALANGDAQVNALKKKLQREREEHEALRMRLAAFHETLAMLPPELQQSFFDGADEGTGDGIGRRSSAFASALGSFIDAAVDEGGEDSVILTQ